MKMLLAAAGLLALGILGGCGSRDAAPPPFQPVSISGGRPSNPTDPGSPVDRPGLIREPDEPSGRGRRVSNSAAPEPSVGSIVRENVKGPWETAQAQSATIPAARN